MHCRIPSPLRVYREWSWVSGQVPLSKKCICLLYATRMEIKYRARKRDVSSGERKNIVYLWLLGFTESGFGFRGGFLFLKNVFVFMHSVRIVLRLVNSCLVLIA